MDMKNTAKSKKLKYGSLSFIFTAVFVVLIIAINLIMTSVDNKVGLKIDLTSKQLYSISGETDTALQIGLGDAYSSFDVTIYFLANRDLYEYYDAAYYSSNKNDSHHFTRVRDLAEEYARLYPENVKVEFVDINKEPELANKYKNETQTSLSANNIIVQGKHHYRILSFNAFYVNDQDTGNLYAFQGERRMTAAILQSSLSEAPIISFTTGHGESWDAALTDIFSATEFDIKTVDLLKEEIDPLTKILVVFNPTNDFIGYEAGGTGSNEIDKIANFMSDKQNYNSVMVFVNASTPAMPNLQEYLWDYWGLDYIPNYKLVDESNSVTNGSDFFTVIGEYVTGTTSSAAYVLHKSVSDSGIRSAFRNAVALKVDSIGNRSSYPEVSIKAHSTAYTVHTASDGTLIKETGNYPLLAISTYQDYGDNNAVKYKYVMLCGSTDFASSTYLKNSFGNSSVLYTATRNMSTDRVIPDIDYKTFEDTALTLTTEQADTIMWFIILAFPVIIMCVGFAVFFKRRHL